MYQESGNFAQALTILPRAVAPLEASDSAAALYARALRCQLQAAHGQPVAALALLLKMEEHCAEWLSPTRAPSGEALLSWLRLRIAEGYSQELGPAARQTLDVSMAQARSTAHAADHPGLLRLHPAVPLLFPGENAPPVQAHPRPPGKTGNRLEE
jgi:hypothetical protein